MVLVGFKKATIDVFDKDGQVVKQIVIQGKQDEGATTSAEITGLSAEPVKVYGSDIAYYVSQRGTNNPSVNLGLLDVSNADSDQLLGFKVAESGITFVGNDTEPPYCSLMLESSDLEGNVALLGFFRGKFSKENTTLNTLGEGTYTPEAENFVFTPIEDDREGDSSGQVMGKYVGSEETAITSLRELVVPEVTAPEG